jgi:hypothetical protein
MACFNVKNFCASVKSVAMSETGAILMNIIKMAVPVVFLILVAIASFKFRAKGALDSWSFGLALSFGLGGFALLSSRGDVMLFKFWNMEVRFRKIKKSEKAVRSLAAAVLELAKSNEGGYKQLGWDGNRYEEAKRRLETLIKG